MDSVNTRNAVYVGSFDPPTLGHLDIIRRGSRLFEKLTVGIGINPDKRPLFDPQERVDLVIKIVAEFPNVDVLCFEGLTVNFARKCNAAVLLRGVRTVSDTELEFTMALTNHVLAPPLETVFLMASEKYSHISSTLIKQIAQLGGLDHAEKSLRDFVPRAVIRPLMNKVKKAAAHSSRER